MKKVIILALATVFAFTTQAQSDKFNAAMKGNIAQLGAAFANPSLFVDLGNKFERIATAEKTQWLAYYYAAYCHVNAGFMERDKSKVDGIADKATLLINKADSLMPNNSEISCIKSMIASCHMMVDPMTRWQEYGQASQENMEKAMEQDPTNPRPYMLKGQGLKFTPESFGGGCKTALPELEKAITLFAAFKPASDIHPNWGMEYTAGMVKECK